MSSAISNAEDKLFNFLGVNRWIEFYQANRRLVYFALAIILVSYGYDIFGFSLRIDAEFYANSWGASEGWISQGRWGMYILNHYLLPDVVMPVIPSLMAVLGLALGGIFYFSSMAGRQIVSTYLALGLLIASPVIYFVNYFTTLGYGIGIGFMFAGLGTYFLVKKDIKYLLLAVICYVFCISIYQALLPVIAVMFGFALLDNFIAKGSDYNFLFTKSLAFIVALLAGYGLYELIKNLYMDAFELEFDDAYLSGFSSFELSWEYLTASFDASYKKIKEYYTGSSGIYLYDLVVMEILFHLSVLLALIKISYSSTGFVARLLSLALFLLVLLTPAAMLIMNNGVMPPRTMLAMPVVFASLVYWAGKSNSKLVVALVCLLAVSCLFKYSVVVNRYSFASAMQWEADKNYSMLLLNDIKKMWDKLPPKTIHGTYPVEIVGVNFERETAVLINREVVGASFYQWGAGDIHRIMALFRVMGVKDYVAPYPEHRIKIIPEVLKMPNWPQEGSVAVINNVIVVKIDDYNINQLQQICRGQLERAECKLAMQ